MAETNVKIGFKIDGLDGYITDLKELQSALSKADSETSDLSKETDKLSNSQKEAKKEIDKTTNTIGGLNKKLNELQDELNQTEIGSEAFVTLQGKIKDTEKELDKAKTGTLSFGDTLGQIPGPIGGVTQSVKGLGTAFKALLANPIVLVVSTLAAALITLFKAFTSTKEGAEALDRVTAGLSAVFDVFRDLLVEVSKPLLRLFTDPKQAIIDFGEAIKTNITNRFEGILEFVPAIGSSFKKLFEGDFAGAAETAGNAFLKVTTGVEDAVGKVGDVINEAVTEASEASRLTGVLQELDDRERELNVTRAEQNKLLAEAKLRADDQTLSIEERQAAVEEAARLEQEVLNQQLALEKERLAALEALAEQSDSDAETLDELAAQRIKLAQLEEQSLNKQTEIQGKRKALTNEQAAADKAAADAATAKREAEEEAAQAILEAQTQLQEELRRSRLEGEEKELDDLRLNYEKQLEIAGENAELRKEVEEQYQKDKQEIIDRFDKEQAEKEKKQQETLDAIIKESTPQVVQSEFERARAELEVQQQKLIEEARLNGATQQQIEQIENNFSQKRKKLAEEETKFKKNLDKAELQSKLNVANDALNAITQIAGEQSVVGKAAAVASATINTYQAATNALANTPAPPPFPQIAAGVAIASGLLNVRNILKTDVPGEAGGGGTIPSISSGVGSVPTFDPNRALQQQNNDLSFLQNAGESITPGGATPEPIRAYVISTEVESSLAANNQIENLSRL